MAYLSQTLNEAAEGKTFALRLKYALFLLATSVLLLPIPWLVVVIALTMLWVGIIGWTYKTAPAQWLSKKLNAGALWLARKVMKDERDSPYLFSYIGIGIYAPLLFIGSYYFQVVYLDANNHWGWENWLAALAYNVLNYGPYFAFFSQVATMIHKEGHTPKGMFKKPFEVFNNFHGHFLAMLYGHVPQGYPMGHMRIHHKHDNAADDVTSTIFYDRSHAARFLIYLLEFALFWSGISVAHYHYKKGKMAEFRKMAFGMLVFYGFMAVVMSINFWFGFAYLLIPHLSCIFLLAAINYTWHAWTDPSEPKNIYKNSITVLDGQYNVYNEDFHVEHHKRPQTHWREYPVNFEKHIEEYKQNRAVIFQETQAFEVFFLILFNDFEKMADKFVDLNGDMSREDIIALLKYRLQPAL
ncbi:MAG: fatty acid desaturase [Flavobacteriales bacterium]|nr:fatty acid desaturase [Flavobacteriales bacterium]